MYFSASPKMSHDEFSVRGRKRARTRGTSVDIEPYPRVTQEPTAMIAFATLLSFIGVVAVAFECDVAALAFMGLAVGVARYLA
jgi:hypothetical protein